MPRSANLLMLGSMLLFFAAGYATVAMSRLSGGRPITALLMVQTALTLAFAAVAVDYRSWWDLVTAVILLAGSAFVWEAHLAARAGRPSRLVWRRVSRALARERGRSRLWTLEELRAEYAQTILDDAARDPELAAILDRFADGIAAEFEKPDGRRVVGPKEFLTVYANGHLDSLSDPGREPHRQGYRGYSTDMLIIAAVCQAADRLETG